MRLRLLVLALFLSLIFPAVAADTVRLVMLGDTTLFGYNMPPDEALPLRLQSALTTPERSVEIVRSQNIDTTKSALIWLLTKSAKAVLANPDGAALILGIGYWDCGVMSRDQTLANFRKLLAVFETAGMPILLVETQPRTFCGADYNATYGAIFTILAEEFGTLLFVDTTPPPPDERPEGVNYITRPVPFDDLLPHVEKLLTLLGT
jgi:acyl-CoA thioesterase I